MLWYILVAVVAFGAGFVSSNVFTSLIIRKVLAYHFAAKGYNDKAIQQEIDAFWVAWREGKSHIPKQGE